MNQINPLRTFERSEHSKEKAMNNIDLPPIGATVKDGRVYNSRGNLIEMFEGNWCEVKNGGRFGWWRFNEHRNRDGYCDDPARGY